MEKQARRRAMTLIELLVVMAIIGILASLILPVIAGFVRKAKDANCVAHMNAWSKFIFQYSTEHDDELPPLATSGKELYHAASIDTLFDEYELDYRIAYCPANGELYPKAAAHQLAQFTYSGGEAGETSLVPIIVDNTDTTAGDNYFEKSCPTAEGISGTATETVSYGPDSTWIRCSASRIVDNKDSGFSCSPGITGSSSTGWAESGAVDEYEGSSYTTRLNGATATWTPALSEVGIYDVYAWWAAQKADGTFYTRDTKADYTITHAGGSSTVQVNQNNNSGSWVLLGSYTFNADGTETVTVEHDAEDANNTCADAIKWEPVGDPGSQSATWHFTIPDPEGTGESVNIEVQGWWPTSSVYAVNDATFRVSHDGGFDAFVIDQQTAGSGWHSFATFAFTRGQMYTVVLNNSSDHIGEPGTASASPITFTIDNLDSGFSCSPGITGSSSTGWAESGAVDEYEGSSYTTRLNGATATWTPALSEVGIYDVYAWWAAQKADGTFYTRDTKADYTITHAGGSSTVQVNQNNNSGSWVLLGSYTFNADGTETVTVEHDAEDANNTCADAIRLIGNAAVVDPNSNVYADAVQVIVPVSTGGSPAIVFDCIGYLYLGYRADVPTGQPPPDEEDEPELVRYADVEAPSLKPILVDWISDDDSFSSHGSYGHVLTMDGAVQRIDMDDPDVRHRWTSELDVKFYW